MTETIRIMPCLDMQNGRVVIDVDQNPALPSGYEVYVDGGRTTTGADAVEWAKKVDGWRGSKINKGTAI